LAGSGGGLFGAEASVMVRVRVLVSVPVWIKDAFKIKYGKRYRFRLKINYWGCDGIALG
jgi:hypothetical protein